MSLVLGPKRESDRGWIAGAIVPEWGSLRVVSRGRLTDDASELPGLVAERDGRAAGYALLRLEGAGG